MVRVTTALPQPINVQLLTLHVQVMERVHTNVYVPQIMKRREVNVSHVSISFQFGFFHELQNIPTRNRFVISTVSLNYFQFFRKGSFQPTWTNYIVIHYKKQKTW